MSVSFFPRSFPPPAPEHVLWVIRQDTREARAVLCGCGHGVELRFLYRGEVMWTRTFAPDDLAGALAAADGALGDWTALGWERVTE